MSTTTDAPTTKRDPLTRGRIVDAALELARQDGLEALSMRKLAEHLGVSTMAAYRHIEGREELVLAIASRVFDEILALHPVETGPWDRWVQMLAERSYDRLSAIPGLAHELRRPAALDLATLSWVSAFSVQARRRRPSFRDDVDERDDELRARAFAQSVVWLVLAAADGLAGQDRDALVAGVDMLIDGYTR